jgi:hypothetical protein
MLSPWIGVPDEQQNRLLKRSVQLLAGNYRRPAQP